MKQLIFYKNESVEDVTIVIVPEGKQPFPSVTKPTHRVGVCTGWSLAPGGSPIDEGTEIDVQANINFFPVWTGLPGANKKEITFKANGAMGSDYTDYCDEGSTYVLPTTTEFVHPLGYVFGGWATAGDSTSKVISTLMDRDKTFYAIWKNPTTVGLGHATGKYIPISNVDNMSKAPVTSNGFLPFGSWLAPHQHYNGFPVQLDVMYKGVAETTMKTGARDYRLAHPDDLENYSLNVTTGYGPAFMIKDVNTIHQPAMNYLIQGLPNDGVFGKTFRGWASRSNIKEDLVGQMGSLNRFTQIWPVYRKDDEGQFSVTIDANDGSGRTVAATNVDNEALFVDDGLISSLGVLPPEGKVFAGLSESADGTPIYHNYYIVTRDCTLYAIWVDA